MRDHVVALLAIAAGGLFALAVFAIGMGGGRLDAARWLEWRRRAQVTHDEPPPLWTRAPGAVRGREWLVDALARAGWHERPESAAVVAVAAPVSLAVLGVSTLGVFGPSMAMTLATIGALAGCGAMGVSLAAAISARRRRLSSELVPLLELFSLELSAGSSPATALGSVATQVEGELAADIRRLLIASQVAGSASFEARLLDYAEKLDIAPLASLSAILSTSREYGTGVAQGVRALATDLRGAQRRELIAHSRRALNHVLFPAAVGVLLPFLAILLFPAVTTLARNFR